MAEQQEEKAAKNTVTIEQAGPCRKKVIVEIPKDTIAKATDDQYETLRKDALVPGFRKGRAPRRLLEKRFGKEAGETVKLKLLAEASESAIKDSKLEILRDPEIDHEKIELPADGPLKFDFEVEVRPEFDLPSLDGIAVEKTKTDVTEGLVEKEIEALRRYSGTWMPKEGGAVELGDQVVADCLLNIEGQEQKLDNTEVHVKTNGFIGEVAVEKLDEVLAGAKAQDTRSVEVTLPKTYFKEELRGKKVDIRLTIKEIKWLKPAEIDQGFITKCGVTTEEELRKSMRERLRQRLEHESKNQMAEQIYKYLLDNVKFDLPVDVAADQAIALLRRQYVNLMMQGVQREQIDEHIEQLKASTEQQAQQQLKIFFIMDKVAEKLDIKITEEEINGHIAQMAIERHVRPERMKEEMQRDGSIEQFRQQVREQKVIAKLLETAKITEVEPKQKPAKAEHPRHRKTTEKSVEKTAEKPIKKAEAKDKSHPAAQAKAEDEQTRAKKPKTPTRKKKTSSQE
ncbi:MAG: trigger factor [Sedimentisphaerales bacterium]|nr:trigger factor [Sedimentisphaerales bacterium]